jgi:hypothetical protein
VYGIYNGYSSNNVIQRKYIKTLHSHSNWGYAYGIYAYTWDDSYSGLDIFNNQISDLMVYGSNSTWPYLCGIYLDGYLTGVRAYYNVISLYGSLFAPSNYTNAACIAFGYDLC